MPKPDVERVLTWLAVLVAALVGMVMGVLHGVAHGNEQLDPLADG